MNQFACRYAIVQFAPHVETGEFANVGVVLMCPQTGYFDFKLQTRKHKRVTDFFDELPRDVYLRAVQESAANSAVLPSWWRPSVQRAGLTSCARYSRGWCIPVRPSFASASRA